MVVSRHSRINVRSSAFLSSSIRQQLINSSTQCFVATKLTFLDLVVPFLSSTGLFQTFLPLLAISRERYRLPQHFVTVLLTAAA